MSLTDFVLLGVGAAVGGLTGALGVSALTACSEGAGEEAGVAETAGVGVTFTSAGAAGFAVAAGVG
jgi:hypothetical protein